MSEYNGQQYQHATIDFRSAMSGVLGGIAFKFENFKALNYKIGAKKDPVRNARGKITGYTIKEQEADGNLVVLKAEYLDYKKYIYSLSPTNSLGKLLGIGEIMFDSSITYGNSINTLQTDRVFWMFQEEARKSTDDQAALEIEIPLFVFDAFDPNDPVPFINYR